MAASPNALPAGYEPSPCEGAVTGGVSSSTTAIASPPALPRRSVARDSTATGPSGPPTVKGPPSGIHAPPSHRYSIVAAPTGSTPPSDAVREKGVEDVTN